MQRRPSQLSIGWNTLHRGTRLALLLVGGAILKCEATWHGDFRGRFGHRVWGWPISVVDHWSEIKWEPRATWYPPFVTADVLFVLFVLASTAWTIEHWLRSENPMQLRLRTSFVLTTVVAGLSLFVRWRTAIASIPYSVLSAYGSSWDVESIPVRLLLLFGVGCAINAVLRLLGHFVFTKFRQPS